MRSCRVYYRDTANVEHAVYVQAVDRYHAYGLALHQLRQCSWCSPDAREVRKLWIQIVDQGAMKQRIPVTREEFEAWLAKPGASINSHQAYVRMLLGRDPPSRDFRRGIKAR